MIYNLAAIITTFTIIFGYLYLRVTRNIIIILLDTPISAPFLVYFILLLLSSFFALMVLLYNDFFVKKPNAIIQNIISRLQNYNIFFTTYSLIFNAISVDYTYYLVVLARHLIEFSNKKLIIIIFNFVVLPRLVIILVLLIEVFFIKSLHYYFYSMLLLMIPLFFRLLIFIFNDLNPKLFPIFDSYLEKSIEDTSYVYPELAKTHANTKIVSFSLKPEYEDVDQDSFMFYLYNPIVFLPGFMTHSFLPLYYKINKLSLYIYNSLLVSVWLYILITFFLCAT